MLNCMNCRKINDLISLGHWFAYNNETTALAAVMRELGEMKQDIPESLQIRCAIAYFMCELRSEGTSLQDLADSFMLVEQYATKVIDQQELIEIRMLLLMQRGIQLMRNLLGTFSTEENSVQHAENVATYQKDVNNMIELEQKNYPNTDLDNIQQHNQQLFQCLDLLMCMQHSNSSSVSAFSNIKAIKLVSQISYDSFKAQISEFVVRTQNKILTTPRPPQIKMQWIVQC